MKTIASILLGLTLSTKLCSAQGRLTCDGSKNPVWDHCDEVWDYYEMEGNTELVHRIVDSECEWWFWDVEGGNCRITHCFADWQDADSETSGAYMTSYYEAIKNRCQPRNMGGIHDMAGPPPDGGEAEILTVYNDPDFDGVRSRSLMTRSETIDHGNGFMQGTLSRAEFDEWLGDTSESDERRHLSQSKRQVDDDEEWVDIEFSALAGRKPDEFVRGPRMSSGTWEYTVSESTTFSVSTSVEIGAAWNIFTASVGIEMSQEDTFTTTETFTYTVDCPDSAQITFWPLFDYHEVYFVKSEQRVEIWVPSVSGSMIAGEIGVECIG